MKLRYIEPTLATGSFRINLPWGIITYGHLVCMLQIVVSLIVKSKEIPVPEFFFRGNWKVHRKRNFRRAAVIIRKVHASLCFHRYRFSRLLNVKKGPYLFLCWDAVVLFPKMRRRPSEPLSSFCWFQEWEEVLAQGCLKQNNTCLYSKIENFKCCMFCVPLVYCVLCGLCARYRGKQNKKKYQVPCLQSGICFCTSSSQNIAEQTSIHSELFFGRGNASRRRRLCCPQEILQIIFFVRSKHNTSGGIPMVRLPEVATAIF